MDSRGVSARLLEPGGTAQQDSPAAANQEVQPTRTAAVVRAACRVQEVENLVTEALRTLSEIDAETSRWDALDRIIATFKERMPAVDLAYLVNALTNATYPDPDERWDSDFSVQS